jgi:putative ABC transport system substrate-binding protein
VYPPPVMTRARFLAAAACLGFAALHWPAAFAADPKPTRLPRVGFLHPIPTDEDLSNFRHPFARIFADGLRELGWRDGENAQIVWRGSGGDEARMHAQIDELAKMPVEVIVLARGGDGLAKYIAGKYPSMPVVAEFANLAQSGGLAAIPRPAPSVTGVTIENHQHLSSKRIALLKEAVHAKRVVFIRTSDTPTKVKPEPGNFHPELQASADEQGVKIENLELAPSQLEAGAKLLARDRDAAVIGPFTFSVPNIWGPDTRKVQQVLIRNRVPVLGLSAEAVNDGMLLGYGPEKNYDIRRFPYFVDRILRGASVKDLPIEQPAKFRLGVNLDTAKALGIVIPPAIMLQADLVVGSAK